MRRRPERGRDYQVVGQEAESKTEQIRQASDIVDVVSNYVSLKRAGSGFKGLCPFHNEKTPSFTVNPSRQIFKCFGCGEGGDVFKFIQKKEGVGFREARGILAEMAHITLEESAPAEFAGGPSARDLARVNSWAERWFQAQLGKAEAAPVRKYLEDRGLNDDSRQTFGLGFAPEGWTTLCDAARKAGINTGWLLSAGLAKERADGSPYDAFRNRLMFPIRDGLNRVIAFGGRTLDENEKAKYLNSPQNGLFNKSRCLYGLPVARTAFDEDRSAVLVEGYMDCIVAHQHGFKSTVATLGTALTTEHCRLLRRYVDRVTLLFDSDEAGRRAADAALETFVTEGLDVRVAHVPEGKDPAEMLDSRGSEAFEAVLTSASDALEFKWNQVRHRYRDAASGPDRRRAMEEFLTLIANGAAGGSVDPIQRGLVLNQVGELLGLSSEEVHRKLTSLARRSAPAVQRVSTGSTGPARATDSMTSVMRSLLEVLLNAPDFYAAIEAEFDPGLISSDDELKAIARAFEDEVRSAAGFSLAGLMSRFESTETARRITDLQLAGERKGEADAAFTDLVGKLRAFREERKAKMLGEAHREDGINDRLKEEALKSGNAEILEDASDSRVRVDAICEVARKSNQFAARKHLAAP